MSIVTLDYQGHAIAYQDDGWFNATQAAAKFGKEPAQWARLPATVEYLDALPDIVKAKPRKHQAKAEA